MTAPRAKVLAVALGWHVAFVPDPLVDSMLLIMCDGMRDANMMIRRRIQKTKSNDVNPQTKQ